ncbi:MAG TPA: GMC oxidoreductase [Stellaceae bacterium]|jgi:choline dehydrogenase-like flavoprotein|nr:GMC oxidoreductase [Stellaceae bacterium]
MIAHGIPPCRDGHDVLIVGAGPAGIVQALELRRQGIAVTMLAGGADGLDPKLQAMADAEIADPRRHAPMEMAVRRALGGTSLLWGGRCVAFDEVDFARGWPLGAAEIAPWYDRAIRYLDAGDPVFSAPLAASDPECRFDQLERWSEGRNLRRIHADALASDPGLRIWLGAVATGFDIDPECGRVSGVHVATASGGRTTLRARAIVLACGGLETTRLLLAAQAVRPRLFGGADGPLGRYYMGHLEGRIAEIVFDKPGTDRDFDFFVDTAGRYVRRRITVAEDVQRRDGLLNLAAWPDNPALGDPAHKSAILSLAYLSLAMPGLGRALAPEAIRRKHLDGGVAGVGRHLGNIVRGAPEALREAVRYLYRRYASSPHLPGFFIPNAARRYALFYHAEQAPNPDSTVRLTPARDALGMPRLKIDLRYSEIDARSVTASHTIIARGLRRAGLGRLDYTVPEAERLAHVLDQATDGYHQIGTARMADRPRDGIVDRDCRVHGTPNLFVASSAVFPSSGQANPTLLLSALSARLAARLARELTELPQLDPAESPARPVHERALEAAG